MYKFTFTIGQNDIFNSSMNFNKRKLSIFFDRVFTFTTFIILIYTIYNKSFYSFDNFRKFMLIFSCILFPIIQPSLIYIKSINHAKKIKDFYITLTFENDKVIIKNQNESTEVQYENIYDFIKFKNMIVILYDKLHGQIIPNRVFDNNREEFYEYVSSKIIYAREKQKENKI